MNSIDSIASSSISQEEKLQRFIGLLKEIDLHTELNDFITKMLSLSFGSMNSIFDEILVLIKSPTDSYSEFEESTLKFILRSIEPLILSFYTLDGRIKNRLADIYQNDQSFIKAALILIDRLAIINSSSSDSDSSNNEKFELYVRIVRNYLEADQPENASTYLSKAQYLRPQLENKSQTTDIHFQLSQARILDSTRRFLEAAIKYYDVSKESLVDESDQLACLGQAVSCSILGSAGPVRSQILRRLYNDERSRQLDKFSILEKVYLDRLLLPKDVEEFSKSLQIHQLATLADGTTVLTRAIIDHNLLSVSKIYRNVRINELSKILDLTPLRVEQYIASMITQNRLSAKIDQRDGFIYFYATSNDPAKQSDKKIEEALSQLDDIALSIQKLKQTTNLVG